MSSAENALASRLQSYLVERTLGEKPDALAPRGEVQEVKFDNFDVIGWLPTGLLAVFKVKPHDWIAPSPAADPIGERVRIALFSDWGTGLYGAPEIRKAIETDRDGFDINLHLGDTYYSGSDRELTERLLNMWPSGGKLNRALNGNHEMYSGGKAYFSQALPRLGQSSSCFAFQNTNWLMVGLDSAYIDHNLDEKDRNGANKTNQVEWLKTLIDAAGPKRKVVLFSHHQPFSQLDKPGPKLIAAMGDELLGRIHAWYWGHEHRCVLYEPSQWGFKGRCVGHGGFPEFRDKFDTPGTDDFQWRKLKPHANLVAAPAAEVLDGPNEFMPGQESRYSPHGYVTLRFNGDELIETYLSPRGKQLRDPQKV